MIPCTVISGALIFAMFGATSVAGMTSFAVFYGVFSGVCEYYSFLQTLRA